MGHGGLALASSITVIVNLFSYLLILRKKIGRIDGTRIARSLLVAVLASLVMGAAVHWTAGATAAWFQTLPAGDLWHVLLCIATGVAVYGLAAWMLRAPELRLVLETLSRRRRPSQRRGGGEEGAGLGG